MATIPGRILKSEDVELDGQLHLDAARAESARCRPQQTGDVLAAPKVRIVENHTEYAVIEVTCTCGTGMCFRCDYAGARAPEDSQTQDNVVETPDQTK